MAEKLVIRYSNSGDVSWSKIDASGKISDSGTETDLASHNFTAEATEITLIIPGTTVLLTHADVPATSSSKLQQAIPFAIEDQIAGPGENIHFASGKRDNSSMLSIACVNKAEMQTWLQTATEQKISPKFMLPDFLALPLAENSWTIYIENEYSLVRIDEQLGFSIETANLVTALNSALANTTLIPQQINFYAKELKFPPEELEELQAKVKLNLHANAPDYLTFCAEELNKSAPINLLQNEFKTSTKWLNHLHGYWRLAAIFCLIWLGIVVGSYAAKLTYLKIEQHIVENKIMRIFVATFPNATPHTDPAKTFADELSKYQHPLHANSFIALLSKIGNLQQQQSNIQLQRLNFAAGKLSITITTATFSDLDKFTDSLSTSQVMVKRDNVQTKDSKVIATLTLSPISSAQRSETES